MINRMNGSTYLPKFTPILTRFIDTIFIPVLIRKSSLQQDPPFILPVFSPNYPVRNPPPHISRLNQPSDSPSLPFSNDCCGKCLVTHCVDDGIAHPIGERWESESDVCYEYSCETRDDVLTTVAIKKDCPYFDPECPPNEIYMDEKGCCQLCNVTRPVKSECVPF